MLTMSLGKLCRGALFDTTQTDDLEAKLPIGKHRKAMANEAPQLGRSGVIYSVVELSTVGN